MTKFTLILPLTLLLFAAPAIAQSVVTPAPPASSAAAAIPGVPVCDTAKQDSDSTCAINNTSPECLGAKKTYVSCMAGYDAANGKGPCAQQKSIMLQFCTSDQTLQQCRNARVSYNSCIENPPGY
jgi:hypothetical protein